MLLWAIHDLPAYGTLSGCNVHGYFGCPICAEETGSDWLPVSHKICYHSHRRWLPRDHKFRKDKSGRTRGVGLLYDDWRHVPSEVKDSLWNSLLLEFDISTAHKNRIFRQAGEQYKSWKTHLRSRTYGENATTPEEILKFKDNPPENEYVLIAEWNQFIEHESTEKKLKQRAEGKANRAKKTDVHFLGSKSYAEVSAEWTERLQGTDDEGQPPTRSNLYLHARKTKDGYRPEFVETAAKIAELQDSQGGDSSSTDIDNDPLTQVFGKDKSGRTRGVGSKVPMTKIKATQPVVSEIGRLRREVQDHGSLLQTLVCQMKDQSTLLQTLVKGRSSSNPNEHSPGSGHSASKKGTTVGEGSSSQSMNADYSPIPAHKGYYHLRDLRNENNIAMVRIESVTPGTLVHGRKLQCPEAKVNIEYIYPGFENEPVYLGKQGGAECLADFGNGSFIAWPAYLLKEMV